MRFLIAIAFAISGFVSAKGGTVWDFNFAGASGGVVNSILGVQEAQFLASSILGFNDLDGSGGISTGDTFQDFTMIRISGMTALGGANVTPLDYGTGPGRTHEITIKTAFSGVQISDNAYRVTSIDLFEVYADFGENFTGSDFSDLTTFTDSPLASHVETGVLGGASGGVNTGPTNPTGTIDVVVALSDILNTLPGFDGVFFELNSLTGDPLDTVGSIVLQGIFDANNVVSPPASPLGGLTTGSVVNGIFITSGFDAAFGISGTQLASGTITALDGFDFAFMTRSDGSFAKNVVPEPGSLVIFGAMGICGLGYGFRRRRALTK